MARLLSTAMSVLEDKVSTLLVRDSVCADREVTLLARTLF